MNEHAETELIPVTPPSTSPHYGAISRHAGHAAYPIEDGPAGAGPAPYVTIVLPCYNEGAHVLKEIERITATMNASEFSYEVLCIDDASTDDTLAVLYHEAFHQYIYYSVGNVAPHSWFNEGHGDYYAGAKYKGGKFKIEPFDWRVGTIKGAIVTGQRKVVKEENGRRQYDGNGGYTPLPDFVRFTQGEYYSYPGICYAQGWSLIYFLREIVPKNKKYNEKWGHILQVYFDTLKGEVKLDKDFGGFRPRPRKDDDDDDGDDGDDGDDEDGGGDEGPGDGSPPDTPPGDGGDGGGDPDDPEAANSAPRPTGGFGPQAALDKAVNEAFKDVDWDEFEEAWREGTKRGK